MKKLLILPAMIIAMIIGVGSGQRVQFVHDVLRKIYHQGLFFIVVGMLFLLLPVIYPTISQVIDELWDDKKTGDTQ